MELDRSNENGAPIRRGARLVAAVLALALSSCTDLTAVQQFSAAAPDQAKLDALSDTYVSDPGMLNSWKTLRGTADPELDALTAARTDQKAALDELNGLIAAYMTALGSLSASSLTDVGAQAKVVSDSLSKLNAADKSLGLSNAKISAIGDLLKIVPGDILAVWRAEKLKAILAGNQAAFHALLDTESFVVGRYASDFAVVAGEVKGDKDFADAQAGGQPFARMALLSTDRLAAADMKTLSAARTAAAAYKDALAKLGAAYDKLVDANGDYSIKTVEDLKPYLTDIEKAYSDIGKL